jgi:hypothetical protein
MLAVIDEFKEELVEYKVEQRVTKFQIRLQYAGKVKQFKLSLVSDRDPTE